MKYFLLFAVVAAARALPFLPASIISTGTSIQQRVQDPVGNYQFGYTEGHATGGTFRREVGDIAGNKVGSYGLTDADGRRRVVSYVADAAGFRAKVDTNEPGVDPSKDPAAVAVNKGAIGAPLLAAPLAAAPLAPALAAPALAAPGLAAPIASVIYAGGIPASYSYSIPSLL
ncbi:cuticle protein 14-like [Centruroides sculpturatus]|uniref:cuticle protein 14-like n=1 Tax=Centruroides sculpturatus TaxID=218467 RepID=UPI000C6D7CD2|nr:cuticle protein 14-like [Centruroides sculpturatus]